MSVGTQIAGYRLEEQAGSGGMGVVYRATDLALERPVALKLLSPKLAEDADFRERFLVESRLAASLDHPNVVPVYDAGEVEGQLYLAMRYVEGQDLKALLTEQAKLEPAEAIAICQQVANALDAAHARGLVHRDVKPSNVLLDEQGHAYLADFGLTRRLSEQAPGFESGLSLGTPAYVAPEQIEGRDVDGRADQYSLACLLHECLTGEPPFPRGSEAATLFAHLEEPPPRPSGLESVLPRALAKDPADRYESCAAFVADARRALGVEPRRARWPLALAGAGAVLIGAAALAFFLVQGDGSQTPEAQGRLVRIDPARNEVAATRGLKDAANGIAYGAGRVWLTSFEGSSLYRFEPKTLELVATSANGSPVGIAFGQDGDAYVANNQAQERNVTRFAGESGVRRDAVSVAPSAIAAGRSGVWISTRGGDVGRLSPGLQPVGIVETISVPYASPLGSANTRSDLSGLAVAANGIWVIGDALDRRLWRLDPATHRISGTIRLPFVPSAVAVAEGAVWVTAQLDDLVARINPKTLGIVHTIAVGREPVALAAGADSLWVANAIDRTVTRIDPRMNRVLATIRTEASPEGISFGGGSVWVAEDAR